MSVPNSIEREIIINAPLERVWDLVSVPGWFINTGTIREHRLEERGDKLIVIDEELGEFAMRVEKVEPPHYMSSRWYANHVETSDNLVEFHLDEVEGGVRVRVVESGFATMPEDAREQAYRDNLHGWESELAVAKARLEGSR